MNNEWGSKKDKNGKVRHYRKNNTKKPYGVSRNVAEEDVLEMRKRGMKARLIETNPKHKLYAPYEGTLPVDKGKDEKKQEPEVTQASPDNTSTTTGENEQIRKDEYGVVRVNRSKGYAGKTRFQGWISEPLMPGEHSREFVQPDHMDWGDSELYRKNKGQWDAVYHLPPDHLYDMNEGGGASTQSIVTWRNKKTGKVNYTVLSDERRDKMLKLINEGKSVREARVQTKNEFT